MYHILLILLLIISFVLILVVILSRKKENQLASLSGDLCPNGKCITSAGDNPGNCCCEKPLVYSPGGGSGMPYCLDKNDPGCIKICQDESCGCDGIEKCDQQCANNCVELCKIVN